MARKKATIRGKIRTREHVIADLAVNHVERQVFLCGYSVERVTRDYGVDLLMFTYNQRGEAEQGHVLLQVKATERATRTADQQSVVFRVARADLQRWLAEPMPLLLIVYEASSDTAWWLYVQQHFQSLPNFSLFRAGKTLSVRFPVGQLLGQGAIRLFGQFRDRVLAQLPRGAHQ